MGEWRVHSARVSGAGPRRGRGRGGVGVVSASADNVGARRCGRVDRPASYGPCMPSERRDVTAGLPRKRMAAGLLITDADERVLLVEPVYKAGWLRREAL